MVYLRFHHHFSMVFHWGFPISSGNDCHIAIEAMAIEMSWVFPWKIVELFMVNVYQRVSIMLHHYPNILPSSRWCSILMLVMLVYQRLNPMKSHEKPPFSHYKTLVFCRFPMVYQTVNPMKSHEKPPFSLDFPEDLRVLPGPGGGGAQEGGAGTEGGARGVAWTTTGWGVGRPVPGVRFGMPWNHENSMERGHETIGKA